MRRRLLTVLLAPAVLLLAVNSGPAQEGLGERLGAKLDKGLKELKSEFQEGWAEIRRSVDKLGVEGRVYSRLHWDKALTSAEFDIEVRDTHVIVLSGTVPDAAAKKKAVQLASDTVGVEEVVDQLTVAAPVAQ